MKDNFYIVLPSNSCPLTQPNNQASSYIVDWETGFPLIGSWEVALTEFSFLYTPTISQSPAKISYIHLKETEQALRVNVLPNTISIDNKDKENITIKYFPTRQAEITVSKAPFTIIFRKTIEANYMGFNKRITTSNDTYIVSDLPIDPKKLYEHLNKEFPKDAQTEITPIVFSFIIQHPQLVQVKDSLVFNEHLLFSTSELLCSYFLEHCSHIFEEFKVNQNGLIKFKFKPLIQEIEFSDNLKNLLGFSYPVINNEYGRITEAYRKPQLQNTFNQMYIYSSLVEPIMVGGVQVPLLRSIWIESKYNFGDIVHENIDQLMYLPISSSSINKIEIEIRNDAGQLITFPYGSKTSLTLHFRKIRL